MKKSELNDHARVIRRAYERHKATTAANPLVLALLLIIEAEYQGAHEWLALDPETE